MIRRRRRVREIPFSFDSFLDVVANVVGIIIRLILVVWVGARSYSSVQMLAKPTKSMPAEISAEEIKDPLEAEIARRRQELAGVQARLLEQLRQLEVTKESEKVATSQLQLLHLENEDIDREATGLEATSAKSKENQQTATLTLAELRQRQDKLVQEVQAVEKLPPLKKTLRYRTPISHPVQTEELFFECRRGKVTFLDVGSLLAEVKRSMENKTEQLRHQWQISDVTPPVGAFRLRYVIARERGVLDSAFSVAPTDGGGFRYGLSEWLVEAVQAERGESLTQALATGSQFRRIADTLDAQSVVTFWIYPDSFAIYRQLRDYLYDQDIVVAGRPLPDGVPIACSKKGTASRGQ